MSLCARKLAVHAAVYPRLIRSPLVWACTLSYCRSDGKKVASRSLSVSSAGSLSDSAAGSRLPPSSEWKQVSDATVDCTASRHLPCSYNVCCHRSVGLTYLTAKLATGTTSIGSYPTTLLGQLVNKNFLSQELVRTSGALHSLLDQFQVSHAG